MTTETPTKSSTSATPAPPGASLAIPRRSGCAVGPAVDPEEIGPNFVCTACFGPLEVVYDFDVARATLTHDAIAARAPGIWRYLELLPSRSAAPARGLAVGSTALVSADRLARQTRHRRRSGSRTTPATRR